MRTLPAFIIFIYLLKIGAAAEKFSECPQISDGDYPSCVCKHGPDYDIETNTCPNPKCPVDESAGTYPNCTCEQNNFDYSFTFNECFRVCPENSTGYWPICNCDSDGYGFSKELFECVACPARSTGVYPYCICEEGSNYNETANFCDTCSLASDGDSVLWDLNVCFACPDNSTGEYPNCDCEHPLQYVQENNICAGCPENSAGIYPHCECDNGHYSRTLRSCVKCPTDATGSYPACTCDDESSTFSALNNQCLYVFGEDSSGVQQCDDGYYYDASDGVCKSDIGRICPFDSIGIGPDCLCVRKNYRFDSNCWICVDVGSRFGFDGSIDWNVLRSSVG